MNEIEIKYKGITYNFPKDVSLLDVSKAFQHEYKYSILVGKVNNDICSLNYKISENCNVEFFDLSTFTGNKVYERSLTLLLVKAVRDVMNTPVKVEHSIDKGIYCVIQGLTKEKNDAILKRMYEIVNFGYQIEKLSANRIKMMGYYNKAGLYDKSELLKYISNTYVTVYRLDDIYDYMFGEMVINTSYLKDFNLEYMDNNGCVLMLPSFCDDSKVCVYKHHEKLFNSIIEYVDWSYKIGINTISDFNKMLSEGKWNDLIFTSEATYNKSLLDVANTISLKPEVKLVLISGPSCSGKTTTSKKLRLFLESQGVTPYAISVDDYFKERDETPLDNEGKKDYESIRAIDIELFNNNLKRLLSGEEVTIPTYNFLTGEKEYKKKLKIKDNGVLIIEGLHALNDELTPSISREKKYKIYISPLTCLNLDNHNRLSTSDNRLIRRMVRDNLRRGYNATKTLNMWEKVRKGENEYVFPYQDTADIVLNTSLIYELSVLKVYAEPLLFSVEEDDPSYSEALRLINILRMILPMPGSSIPLDSILREFIGNGCFDE